MVSPLAKKLLRDMKQARFRFLALIVLVGVGVGAYVGLVSSVKNRQENLYAAYDELNFADITIQLPSGIYADAGNKTLILNAMNSLGSDFITALEFRLSAEISLNMSTNGHFRQIRGLLIGLEINDSDDSMASLPAINTLQVEKGRFFFPNETNQTVCVLEHHLPKHYDLQPGSIMQVLGTRITELTVIGHAISPEFFFIRVPGEIWTPEQDYGVLFAPLETVKSLLNITGVFSEVIIKSPKAKELGALIETWLLENQVPAHVVLKEDHPSYALMVEDAENDEDMMRTLPLLVLLGAAFGIYVSLSRLVTSQRREIGIAMSEGYSRRSILFYYLSYSLLIGILGSIVGVGIGWVIEGIMDDMVMEIMPLPFYRKNPVQRIFDVYSIGVGLAIFFCILGGLIPAWNSIRLTPVEALYVDPSTSGGKGSISFVERIFKPLRSLSVYNILPIRNLLRARKRTIATTFGVATSVALLISFVSMSDTLDWSMDYVFDDMMRWDLRASFRDFQPISESSIVTGWEGVKTVDSAIEVFCQIYADSTSTTIQLLGLRDLNGPYRLELSEGNFSGLIISHRTSEQLGRGVGDTVDMEHLVVGGDLGYYFVNTTVLISGIVPGPFGFQSFYNLPLLQQLMGLDGEGGYANILYLSVDRGSEVSIRRNLFTLPDIENVISKHEMRSALDEFLELLDVFLIILTILCLAMVFTLIYNTISINMHERRREFATMRVLGTPMSTIFRMSTIENLLLGILGIFVGLFGGYLLASYLFSETLTEAVPEFSLELQIVPLTLVWISCLVITTVFLSELPSIRGVAKLDLANTTRERAS